MFNLSEIIDRHTYGKCLRKVTYSERKTAEDVASNLRRYGTRAKAYKCPNCHMWHISHMKGERRHFR